MALLVELIASLAWLITKPFLLVGVSCQFGLRSILIVIQTWIELIRTAIYLHLAIFWRLAVFAIAVLSLPFRAFTALFRERMLEMQVHRIKSEFESALWERKNLQEQLRIAIKDRRMREMMLAELESEHDEAIVKIELLEGEIHDLKDEVRRLDEIQGKALMDYQNQGDALNAPNIKISDNYVAPLWKLNHHKYMGKEPQGSVGDALPDPIKESSKIYLPAQLRTPMISKGIVGSEILAKHREVALSRSLFSAILSLVVGIIVWESQDQCMPLVAALFTVVTMSLMSVVQLYSTIDNKPASDAVALLSLTCFVLGTVAYPVLPRVAGALAPFASGLLGRTFEWLVL